MVNNSVNYTVSSKNYWNSKANSFIFAVHRKKLGSIIDEYETRDLHLYLLINLKRHNPL